LLKMEKERRGFAAEKLVFIGIADVVQYYWCAEKSLLANKAMELNFFLSYLHARLLYSLELG